MSDDDQADLDTLTRDELAELDGPAHVVAQVLDEWNHRLHGVTSSAHGAGLFLDLLAAEGWRVTPINVPLVGEFFTPPGRVEVTYMSVASDDEREWARREVLESVTEVMDEQRERPERMPLAIAGGEITPDHRFVLRAYRRAHQLPAVGTAPTPTASEVNEAVAWWNAQHQDGD